MRGGFKALSVRFFFATEVRTKIHAARTRHEHLHVSKVGLDRVQGTIIFHVLIATSFHIFREISLFFTILLKLTALVCSLSRGSSHVSPLVVQ